MTTLPFPVDGALQATPADPVAADLTPAKPAPAKRAAAKRAPAKRAAVKPAAVEPPPAVPASADAAPAVAAPAAVPVSAERTQPDPAVAVPAPADPASAEQVQSDLAVAVPAPAAVPASAEQDQPETAAAVPASAVPAPADPASAERAQPETALPAADPAPADVPADLAAAPTAPAGASAGVARYALLPLRVFLGVTFVYAALDKLSDPHYLRGLSDPVSFAAQAHAAAGQSPIGGLLGLAVHAPTPTGLAMAFGELAVGVGALLGLWGRVAAVGGALISLTLFLGVSWGTHPYYLGNDLPYLMAWVSLAVAGTPQYSLDALMARHARVGGSGRSRRQVLQDGGIAAMGAAGAVLLVGAGAARIGHRPAVVSAAKGVSASDAEPAVGASVAAASVPVGGSLRAVAPGSGDPVYVLQPKAGTFAAFSGVCSHAGCTVNPPKDGKFVCPCHGSSFDATTGAVLQGPATRGLARYQVTKDGDKLRIAD